MKSIFISLALLASPVQAANFGSITQGYEQQQSQQAEINLMDACTRMVQNGYSPPACVGMGNSQPAPTYWETHRPIHTYCYQIGNQTNCTTQ